MRKFKTGATRNDDRTKPDYEGYLSPAVLAAFGRYMTKHRLQADGTLRDSDNWQRGIPRDVYIKSLVRHVFELWAVHRGGRPRDALSGKRINSEDAICAILFNASGYLFERLQNKRKRAES
jgi:hypothetical protein